MKIHVNWQNWNTLFEEVYRQLGDEWKIVSKQEIPESPISTPPKENVWFLRIDHSSIQISQIHLSIIVGNPQLFTLWLLSTHEWRLKGELSDVVDRRWSSISMTQKQGYSKYFHSTQGNRFSPKKNVL